MGDVVVAAAAGAAALQRDLELAESRVDVVVLLVELVRLGTLAWSPTWSWNELGVRSDSKPIVSIFNRTLHLYDVHP